MQVPAIVIDGASQYEVTVRVHNKTNQVGDLAGTNLSYAEHREEGIDLIFWRYQLVPVRGMVVSVELGEAYYVEYVDPPDDITIKAKCTRASAAEALGLPLPDAAGSYQLDLPTTWYPSNPSVTTGSEEFLPIPELLDETATYFFMGWADVNGTWLIRRKERTTTEYLDASGLNNGAYADLASAWVDRLTLVYE